MTEQPDEDRHVGDPRFMTLLDLIAESLDDVSGSWDSANAVIDWIDANTVPKDSVLALADRWDAQTAAEPEVRECHFFWQKDDCAAELRALVAGSES